jgi:hypothetical protein
VVANSFRDSRGDADSIIVSQDILDKLGCNSGEAVKYKKATIYNVLWAKKWTIVLAALGVLGAVAQGVVSLASLFPASSRAAEVKTVWISVAVVFFAAFVVAVIIVSQANSNASS